MTDPFSLRTRKININYIDSSPEVKTINKSNRISFKSPSTSNTYTLEESKISTSHTDKDDFKLKYKTERCKYWDLYKDCKYKDNVSLLLYYNILLVCICSWRLRYKGKDIFKS